VNRRQRNLPFHQVPRPDTHHQRHVEGVKHKSATKYYGVIAPSILRSHPNSGNRDSPRQHPEEVRAKSLDEKPSSRSGKYNSSNLVVDRIEYVTPINSLRLLSQMRCSLREWYEPSTNVELSAQQVLTLRDRMRTASCPRSRGGCKLGPPKREQ
jgi:hypothetical protein